MTNHGPLGQNETRTIHRELFADKVRWAELRAMVSEFQGTDAELIENLKILAAPLLAVGWDERLLPRIDWQAMASFYRQKFQGKK